MKLSSVYVTTSAGDEALKISRILMTAKLAACANILPAKSIHRREGKLEESGEAVVFLKTPD